MNDEALNWLATIIMLGLGFLAVTAHWLIAVALAPRFVGRCRDAYARPFLATLIGLAVWLPFLVLALAHAGDQRWLAALLTPPTLLATSGSAGLALRIGVGLADAGKPEPDAALVRHGGRLLACSVFLPVVGWFALLPFVALSGAGAAVRALVTRRREG